MRRVTWLRKAPLLHNDPLMGGVRKVVWGRMRREYSKQRWANLLIGIWLIFSLIGNRQAYAQKEIPEDLVIKVGQFDATEYPEITLYINVTDRSGKNVSGLVGEDFVVTEDDQVVEVVDFAGIGEARPVDIAFVFDTTGSMEEEIEGLVRTSKQFADELESKGRDYRLGLVTFADVVLKVFNPDNTLTDDAEEFKGWVGELEAEGGDGDPENDYGAIKRASQMQFRDGSQKIFILITDAPPHHFGDDPDGGNEFDDPDLDYQRILDLLNDQSISVYAVAPAYNEFSSLTSETGGSFYDIQRNPDFTGIIEDIGETIASQYRITYRSPRPTYDGTRRDVKIQVGEADVTTAYAEKHLLTVESNCLVGILCLLPLLLALVVPFGGQRIMRYLEDRPDSATPEVPVKGTAPEMVNEQPAAVEELPARANESLAPPPAVARPVVGAAALNCLNCGNTLKPSARFCTSCGQPVGLVQPPPARGDLEVQRCPNCGQDRRPGAKFCNRCGFKL